MNFEKLKEIFSDMHHDLNLKDAMFALLPTGGSFATITLVEMESITRIICLLGGLACSIYIAFRKPKNKKDE